MQRTNNKLIYDNCASVQKYKQSISASDYVLYSGKYNNEHECRIKLGQVGGNNVSKYTGNMIDLESNLLGITHHLSLCSENKYKQKCNNCNGYKGLLCDCLRYSLHNLKNLPSCQIIDYNPYIYDVIEQSKSCNWKK